MSFLAWRRIAPMARDAMEFSMRFFTPRPATRGHDFPRVVR
jgi:hypothetical protein